MLVASVFPPEPLSSGFTSHALAQALAGRGHKVTVLANYPNRPNGRTFPGYRRSLFPHRERQNGIEVVRCFSTISRSSTLLSRLAENLSFGLSAGCALAMATRPDVIYINAWPLFAASIVSFIAWARGIPIVQSIQDVYPESLVSLGRLDRGASITKWLMGLDAAIGRISSAVVVISEAVEEIYLHSRGIPRDQVHRIPNWRPVEHQPSLEAVQRQRRSWGVAPGDFLLVFAGNVAEACGIENVISAVSGLSSPMRLRMVVAGAGSALTRCRNLASRICSERVTFSGSFAPKETLSILGAGDLLILPTQGDQSLVSMPSKLISYMMAGRPILAVAHPRSDLARAVIASGCGWVIAPGDPALLARELEGIVAVERTELIRKGQLGREYALANYATEACLPRLVAVVEEAAARTVLESRGREDEGVALRRE
jgi:glycosyltransferase involved in cell wall biosynthesis